MPVKCIREIQSAKGRAGFVRSFNLLIKENNEITHNSIFADFQSFRIPTSCVLFEIRNQTVKDLLFGTRRNRPSLNSQLKALNQRALARSEPRRTSATRLQPTRLPRDTQHIWVA